MNRLLVAMLCLATLMNPACNDGGVRWIRINDKARDATLAKLGEGVAELRARVDDLQVTVDVPGPPASADAQSALELAVHKLHAAIAELTRSVETMKVAMTDLRAPLVEETTRAVGSLGQHVAALAHLLRAWGPEAARRLGAALAVERALGAALNQMQQLVRVTIRPTLARLSREGDYFVGRIAFDANVRLVRTIATIAAGLALLGLVRALRARPTSGRRSLAVGVGLLGLVAALGAATVLARPISRVGALEHKLADGAARCEATRKFHRTLDAARVDPADWDRVALAIQIKEAAIDCAVMAPTPALSELARDAFVRASRLLGQDLD